MCTTSPHSSIWAHRFSDGNSAAARFSYDPDNAGGPYLKVWWSKKPSLTLWDEYAEWRNSILDELGYSVLWQSHDWPGWTYEDSMPSSIDDY